MKATNGYPGLYIVFEGIIGCGKSTQIRLFQDRAESGYPGLGVVYTREPGGTPQAEEIRDIVKHQKLEPWEEVKLFARARASNLDEVVRPALARGQVVIKDRDVFSSLAYQGEGRGLGWQEVWKVNKGVVCRTLADCYVFVDIGTEPGVCRSRGVDPDKFDAEERGFWERTRRGYLEVLSRVRTQFDKINIIVVSDPEGRLSPEEVHKRIMGQLHPIIDQWMFSEGRINGEGNLCSKENKR